MTVTADPSCVTLKYRACSCTLLLRKVFALRARFPGQKHPTRRVIAEVGTITIDQVRQIARDWQTLKLCGNTILEAARA